MLEHVAITINQEEEIENFYKKLLGFEEKYSFEGEAGLMEKIFGIPEKTEIFLLEKGNLNVELFLTSKKNKKTYQHICIAVENREKLLKVAKENGYRSIVIPREEKYDLVFIEDQSGNLFEVREEES